VLSASAVAEPRYVGVGAASIVLGFVLLGGFAWAQRNSDAPLIPREAWRSVRLRIGAGTAFVITATTSSAVALAALALQQDLDIGPAAAGLIILPCSLSVVIGSAAAGRALKTTRAAHVLAIGLGTIAVGTVGLIAMAASIWAAPIAVAVIGLGLGLASVASTTTGMDVDPALQGTSSGVLNTLAQLGTAIGVAGLFTLAAVSDRTAVVLRGDPLAWTTAALIAAATAAVVVVTDRREAKRRPTTVDSRTGA
jgi:hypothetical protein